MHRFSEFLTKHWDLFTAFYVLLGMILYQSFGSRLRGYRDVAPSEAVRIMNHDEALLLDVREDKEYREGHVPGSQHIPLSRLASELASLEPHKGKPVIVGCRSGSRSARACGILRKRGFQTVYNLRGGVMAWQDANLPLAKPGKRKKK